MSSEIVQAVFKFLLKLFFDVFKLLFNFLIFAVSEAGNNENKPIDYSSKDLNPDDPDRSFHDSSF